VKFRTTPEQRDALRRFIVDRIIAHPESLTTLPDVERWREVAQVLLDCDEAIFQVESIENRLANAFDEIVSAQTNVASVLTVIRRR